MRLGILGGSFDPVHYGHLLLAECCREQCRLDRVWFVPAAQPPHKGRAVVASADQRVEMLRLAIGGHEAFEVSLLEVQRGGASYTADTLEEVRLAMPEAELFLLLGVDLAASLPRWRGAARLVELATPVVVRPPDAPEPDLAGLLELASPPRRDDIRAHLLLMPRLDLRSRELRRRVSEGRSIRYQTPRAVEMYIHTHGLYRAAPDSQPLGSVDPPRCE